jgi:spore germination protein GerM
MTAQRSILAAILLGALAAAGCAEPPPPPGGDPPPPAPAADPPPTDVGAPTPESPAPETLTVLLYFTRGEEPEPVEREIHRAPAVLRATLEQLLAGPTPAERARGLSSWFAPETAAMLRDVHLDADGRATIDFHDLRSIIPGASTAAGSRILLNELERTVFQFDTVRSIEYRLNGSCAAFWEWLQRDCGVVTRE